MFSDSVPIAEDKIEKNIAMQVMPQTAEQSNIERYLQYVQNPYTPKGSMPPSRSTWGESIDQRSPRILTVDVTRVCNRNNTITNNKGKLASIARQSLGKHVHDDKIGGLRTPEPTRKRLRSSKTMEHINVGDEQSPT